MRPCSPRSTATDVDALVAAAPELLAEHTPLEALRRWFRRVADYAKVKRGVFGAVDGRGAKRPVRPQPRAHRRRDHRHCSTPGRPTGTVRDDVDARDVILLIGYLTRLDETEWDARANRLLDIILDGLRRRQS